MNTTSLLLIAATCTMLSCRVADPMPAFRIVARTYACPTCDTFGLTGLSLEQAQSFPPNDNVYIVYRLPDQGRQFAYGELAMVQPQETRDTVGLHSIADALVTSSIEKPRCSMYKSTTAYRLAHSDAVLDSLHLWYVRRYPEEAYAPTTLAVAMRNIEAIVPASTMPESTKPNTPLIVFIVLFVSIIIGLLAYGISHMYDDRKFFRWPTIPSGHF